MFNHIFVSAVQKLTKGRVMVVVLWIWQGDRGVAVMRLCSRPMMVMRGIGRRSGAGCDEVPRHLLNDCAEFIVETLTVLTNKYLTTTAKFPDAIKLSKVVPVHKNSCTQDLQQTTVLLQFIRARSVWISQRKIPNGLNFQDDESSLKKCIDPMEDSLLLFYDTTEAFDLIIKHYRQKKGNRDKLPYVLLKRQVSVT